MGLFVLAASAACAGVLVGLSGCEPCDCGTPPPITLGTYTVVQSDRPELVDAVVEVTADRVGISFADAQGQDWVVNFEMGRD